MKEQMTEKKKLEDVTEVQMKYQKEIEAIVRGMSSPKVMHDRLLDYHENDIAAALEDMNPTERQRLYRILNAEEISEVLSYIDEEEIPSYLEEMDMKKKAAVVSEMDADEIADLLRQMDKNLVDAAQDLGCTWMQAFWKVIIPEIKPGIVSGALTAFTMSIDDFVISYFTAGSSASTLAMTIYGMTKKKVTPEINAISTLLFVTVLILLAVINLREARQERKRIAEAAHK